MKNWQVLALVILATGGIGIALAQVNSPSILDFLVALIITLLTLLWIDVSRRPRT